MYELYINGDIDLEKLCVGWKKEINSYELESQFDEFITIDKNTRHVNQYGYNSLINKWIMEGTAVWK